MSGDEKHTTYWTGGIQQRIILCVERVESTQAIKFSPHVSMHLPPHELVLNLLVEVEEEVKLHLH